MQVKMKPKSKRSIFLYNKNNELTTYVDLNKEGQLTGYFHLEGRMLTKMNVLRYKEKNKLHQEVSKARITYDEDCKLFHMFFDIDESYCQVVKKNSNRLEIPNAVSKIHVYDNENSKAFTVKKDLISQWLKKI